MKKQTCLALSLLTLTFLATLATAQKPSLYTISGDVKDSTGQKISGARVCALIENPPPGETIPCVSSGADGEFIIRRDKPGKHLILAEKVDLGYFSQFLPFYRNSSFPTPEVVLGDESLNHRVSVVLGPKNGTLIGKSIDAATNSPLENVQIVLCHAANQQICREIGAKNSDGKFSVVTPTVPFTLKIKAKGFQDWINISGSDAPDSAITVDSNETLELTAYLQRKKETIGQAIGEAEKLIGVNLPAPVQISPNNNQIFNHYPRQTKLEWHEVEGAAYYEIEIDYCQGGRQNNQECINPQPNPVKNDPPKSNIKTTNYEFFFVGAQAGRWRVWAVDKQGREGFKSGWRRFVYTR